MTFYVHYDRIVPANNVYMAALKNNESTLDLVIERILAYNGQVATVTGVILSQRLDLIPSATITGGTTETARDYDTADTTPNVQAVSKPSSIGGVPDSLRFFLNSNEEGSALAAQNWEDFLANDANFQIIFRRSETDGIIVRPGEALGIFNGTNSVVGSCSYIIEFSTRPLATRKIAVYCAIENMNTTNEAQLVIFNKSALRQIKIWRIFAIPTKLSTPLTAANISHEISKISTEGSGGIDITNSISKYDTALPDLSNNDLVIAVQRTGVPTEEYVLRRFNLSNNLNAIGALTGENASARDYNYQQKFGGDFVETDTDFRALTLDQNEGIMISRPTGQTGDATDCNVYVEFSY